MSPSGSSKTRPASGEAARPDGGASARREPSPDDRTVISDRSPAAEAVVRIREPHPFELGKLLAGDRLAHFELLEYVGGGGMGAVFRARDTMLDREVALKVLSRSQGEDEETRRRFHVEAQSAARLDHQNIARVYYVGEDQGLNFIVFEFIQGTNIRDLVERQGPLPVSDAISYTLQIAEALAHASRRDVVHRDIKPSNVIITDEGRAKLVDMGLARLHVKNAGEDLTASGVTLGTFDYISPEQARDPRTADVRSDIYSLGCTLYFMLTGRPPFPDGTVLQKLLQHQGDEPPDPRQYDPKLPEELSTFVRRMLAKDPRQRFQDAGELIGELLLLADRLNLRPVTSSQFWIAPRDNRPTLWERHLPWAVPVAALVIVVAVVNWISSQSSRLPAEAMAINRDFDPPTVPLGAPRARHQDEATMPSEHVRPSEVPRNAPGAENPAKDRDAAPRAVAEQGKPPARPPRSEGEPVATTMPGPKPSDPKANTNGPALATLRKPGDSAGIAAAAATSAEVSVGEGSGAPAPPAASAPSEAPPSAGPRDRASAAGAIAIMGASGDRRQYASLQAACSAARNNDVIELQFNGRRAEEPLELANLKLTIRAGEGFRPVLVFRPTRAGPIGFARSMVTVSGGRLSLLNIGLEFDVPRDGAAEGWSLFETQRAEELRLEDCTLTIRNATDQGERLHPNVTFFQVRAAPGADATMKMPEPAAIHPVELNLQNCIARGEAVFVRSPDAQPIDLQWDNGFLATTDQLFVADGSSVASSPADRVQIGLGHLTAIVHGGLIRLTATADAPHLLRTELNCVNSILVTREAPLVDQAGPHRTAMLEQQFDWNGDRNFCQGFMTFWKLVDTNSPTVPRLMSASEWQAHWRGGDIPVERLASLWKQSPAADVPVHAMRPEDFVLARGRGGSSRFEATDRRDAGMEQLPPLPSEPPSGGAPAPAIPGPRASEDPAAEFPPSNE